MELEAAFHVEFSVSVFPTGLHTIHIATVALLRKFKKFALQRFFMAHTCCICFNGFTYEFCSFEYLLPNILKILAFLGSIYNLLLCFLVNLVLYRYCFVSVLALILLVNFNFRFCFAKTLNFLHIGLLDSSGGGVSYGACTSKNVNRQTDRHQDHPSRPSGLK